MPDKNAQVKERATAVAAGVKNRIDTKLGHVWWAIMSRGLLAVGLGICAFVWPQRALGILIKLLGAYFLADGIIGAVGALRSDDKSTPLLQTVVSLALGLALLLWTGVSGKVFLVLVGIWLILQGLGLFWSSRKIDPTEGERGLMSAVGIVISLIGLVFVFWTDTGEVAISWLIGIAALVVGGLLVYLATRVRLLQSRIESIGQQE